MLQAIPGVFVMLLGVVIVVGRNVFGWTSTAARTAVTGRPSTKAERRGDAVLPLVFGIGLIVGGFWILVYTYALR